MKRPENIDESLWDSLSDQNKAWVVEHERLHEIASQLPEFTAVCSIPRFLLSDIINTDLK